MPSAHSGANPDILLEKSHSVLDKHNGFAVGKGIGRQADILVKQRTAMDPAGFEALCIFQIFVPTGLRTYLPVLSTMAAGVVVAKSTFA